MTSHDLISKLRQLLSISRVQPDTGFACPNSAIDKPSATPIQLASYPFVCYSFYPYDDPVKKRIHAMKFHFQRWIANKMGDEMCAIASVVEFDLITWVPLHYARFLTRGYNPSHYIAKRIARFSGKPLCRLIVRTRHTKAQSTLTLTQRRVNPVGAFAPVPDAAISGKRILLVDDVVTVGATLNECVKVLYGLGASSVTAVTFAVGGSFSSSLCDEESAL